MLKFVSKILASFRSFFQSEPCDEWTLGYAFSKLGGWRTLSLAGGFMVVALIAVALFPLVCDTPSTPYTSLERTEMDSLIKHKDIHELTALAKKYEQSNNQLGMITAFRVLGCSLRSESRFEEALEAHSRGLEHAEAAGDTVEIVRALNNMGTNYRRMGVVDLAADYHYRAWMLTESTNDSLPMVEKNRAMSLNGLANVYITLGNDERADSVLRMALRAEEKVGNPEGRAINMANLGSLFLKHHQYDSAYYYFSQSMELNRQANNHTGIALCNSYFGEIYEERGEYNQAIVHIREAYLQMYNSKDTWHATTTAIALANLYRKMDERDSAFKYLNHAESMARKLKSNEHLAEIYQNYYAIYKKEGNYKEALNSIEREQEFYDSVVNLKKLNRIQEISLRVERNRQDKDMSRAKETIARERDTRQKGYIVFAAILLGGISLIALLSYVIRTRNHSNRMLKEVSRLRENFFTNIAHEFRTPLTLILGLSHDLTQDTTVPAAAREKIRSVERQGDHLLHLINQLLDISKIESVVGNPKPVNGDVVPQLTMIVESYRELATRHDIGLHLHAPTPVVMDFTPDYVVKVMNNLISNALKFTPQYGSVSIDVHATRSWLQVSVSDTGRGIPESDLPHIFEPFFQVEDLQGQGTGIGLSLVRQIMHSLGGTVRVESKWGEGSTFYLEMPIEHKARPITASELLAISPQKEIPTEVVEESGGEDDTRTRILIIEDNREVAHYMAQILGSSYDIAYAHDGREGLSKALEVVPDLIVTDLMMPHTDGNEVCRKVRSTDVLSHIPIIVVSAKGTAPDRMAALEAGADVYMEKPFDSNELRLRVHKLLEQRRRLREKYSSGVVDSKEGEIAHSEEDLRFLGKVVDAIHVLMSRKETDVNTVASRLFMSTRQFHRKVLALTGETPAAYILRIKIRKAQQLLDSTPGMAFTEVAERSGFEDYSVFTRSFRKIVGLTPTQYVRGAGESSPPPHP